MSGLVGAACNFDNPGDPPPAALIYMPAALRVSQQSADQAARYLYVVNSNFDLRYNAGSLQAFDLDKLDAEISRCEGRDTLGMDCEIEPSRVIADEVLVPSFTTGIAASSDHDRLFVVTRDEPGMRVIDTREDGSRDVLSCGDQDRQCQGTFTRGEDPAESPRRLVTPPEPVGVIAGDVATLMREGGPTLSGEFVIVAHRGGQASLFVEESGDELTLISLLENLALEPTGIAFDPESRLAYLSTFDRMQLGYQKRVLSRLGVAATSDGSVALYDAGALSLEGLSSQPDTRAVEVNPAMPGELLVVGRSPASLLFANVSSALDGAGSPTESFVREIASVGAGPSRVVVGGLGDRTIAVVSCFDARQIFVMDAESAELLSIVHNFSGPFEIAIDSQRQRLYVGDFRSSVVRVLDLSHILEGASETVPTAKIIATLGRPQLVQELQ